MARSSARPPISQCPRPAIVASFAPIDSANARRIRERREDIRVARDDQSRRGFVRRGKLDCAGHHVGRERARVGHHRLDQTVASERIGVGDELEQNSAASAA